MSAIYLDNQRLGQITETITREKRIQRQYFEREAAAGRLPVWQPPVKEPPKSLLQTVGLPAYATAAAGAACGPQHHRLGLSLSKHLWGASNPSYVLRDGPNMVSSTHEDYAWRTDELEYMRAHGEGTKQHNRRRDEFVMYVEAAARAHQQLGGRAPAMGKGK